VLFLTLWRLREGVDVREVAKVAGKLAQSGAWPVKGTEIKAWYISPGGLGVTILEAENAEQVFRGYAVWRKELPDMFEFYEVHPIIPAEKAIQIALE